MTRTRSWLTNSTTKAAKTRCHAPVLRQDHVVGGFVEYVAGVFELVDNESNGRREGEAGGGRRLFQMEDCLRARHDVGHVSDLDNKTTAGQKKSDNRLASYSRVLRMRDKLCNEMFDACTSVFYLHLKFGVLFVIKRQCRCIHPP